jgi:hypothetical protein
MEEALLGIATGVGTAVTIAKMIRQDLSSPLQWALALVLTSLFVALGRWSGEVSGQPLELVLGVLGLTATAMGLREGVSLAAGGNVTALRSDSEGH